MKTLKDYGDDQLLWRYARSMVRLFRLRDLHSPASIIEKEEKISANYFAECERRGLTPQQTKAAIDTAIKEEQARPRE